MKKIVHVQVLPKLSGVQQVSLDILKGLDSNYEKYILFGGQERNIELEKIFESYGVKVLYSKYLHREISLLDFKAFGELYKIFKEYKFDIVHTNSTKPGVLARIAAKVAGINKIIHTVHGIAFHKHEPFLKRVLFYVLETFSTLFGDINVTVNKYYLRYYPKILCKSISIYNGVDFTLLDATSIEQLPKQDQVVNVAFFARLDRQKAPLTYIKVVDYIVKNKMCGDNVHFYIAGDGELKEQCLGLITELELRERITYAGWVNEKSEFFRKIDILCQPSQWEAFGLNIVEAAHYAIPCVASNVEGIPEVISDGETGLLCECTDIQAFAQAVSLLANDKMYRDKLGLGAKNHVHENFQVSMMVDAYKQLYAK